MKKIVITLSHTLLISMALLVQPSQAADYTNTLGIDFIKIKAGCFNMGRDPNFERGSDNELPRHRVCIKESFFMGKTEITQAQWVAVMGNNPSKYKGRDKPVDKVSWNDAQDFIQRLNKKEGGNHYRLPTEAEWEYAARAGSNSTFHFGDNAMDLFGYEWCTENASSTHPVAQKLPNKWGLYDMSGNVREWVQDWYDEYYYHNSPTDDPKGPDSGLKRVNRGGSFDRSRSNHRSAYRHYGRRPDSSSSTVGFRLVRKP